MKAAQVIIALLVGLFAILLEFQSPIKTGLWGGPSLFKYFLIFILVVLALVYLFTAIKHYKTSEAKSEFLPLIVTLTLLSIIYAHMEYRDMSMNSKSAYKVYGLGKIEGREITEFDFKTNGSLIVSAHYKFKDERYWGHYKKLGDNLILDIKTDLSLEKKQ